MDTDDGRPSSGRGSTVTSEIERKTVSKVEFHSDYGGTSGIASGTQSPVNDDSSPTPGAIIVPTAEDGIETGFIIQGNGTANEQTLTEDDGQGDDVIPNWTNTEETNVETDQGESESQDGKKHRKLKFSDQEEVAPSVTDSEYDAEVESETQKPGTPVPKEDQDTTPPGGDLFTLFAILPTKDVVTLRDLQSGTTGYDIRAMIELSGGIPSQCYSLVSSSNARELSDDVRLVLGENVTNGSVMRIIPHNFWAEIFRALWVNDVDFVQRHGEVCMMGSNDPVEADDGEKTLRDRLFMCLFIACAKGERNMCQLLLEMGADVNGQTSYGNTALHAAARNNQLILVDLLLKNGATPCQNVFGKMAAEVAKDAGAFSCERYLRLHKWSLTGQNYVISPRPSPSPRPSKPTSATSQRSGSSGFIAKSNSRIFLPRGADSLNADQTGITFSNRSVTGHPGLPNILRRCQSAPAKRDAYSTTQSTRGTSKYHKDCMRKNGTVVVSKPQVDYVGAHSIKYIAHPTPSVASAVETVQVFIPTSTSDGEDGLITAVKKANDGDSQRGPGNPEKEADDPDRTVLAETIYRWENDQNKRQQQNKPRVKSASARLYKSHFHKYLQPEEPVYYSKVKERREKRVQTAAASPEDEARRARNNAAYHKWLVNKTAQGAFSSAGQSEEVVTKVQQYTKEQNERAFERWLEDKEDEEPVKMNCQEKRLDIEVVVQYVDTDPAEPLRQTSDENHRSYQKWLRALRNRGQYYGTTSDEPSDVLRRRIEEKRQKTILNVKAYEEWLEDKKEVDELQRKVDIETRTSSENVNEDVKKWRAPKQVTFSKWLTMSEKNRKKEEEKHRKENMEKAEESRLRREEWSTGTNVQTFKQWYLVQGKPAKTKSNSDKQNDFDRQRALKEAMAKESYDSWAIQKALEDLQLEKSRLREEEKRLELLKRRKQTRLY